MFKNNLKIESNKDKNNSMDNILEELDPLREREKKRGSMSVVRNTSYMKNLQKQVLDDSMNVGFNNKNILLNLHGNSNASGFLLNKTHMGAGREEKKELPVLSEKSKSSLTNDMKLKEESVVSNNKIKQETNSIKSETVKQMIINPKVVRNQKNLREKRKGNIIFQSMEGTMETTKRSQFPEVKKKTAKNPLFFK
jgi:hypothetical protein